MIVQCNLCGGENHYEPGETTLVCSYCGASLTLTRTGNAEIERLVLVHTRNDRLAEAALRSFIAENNREAPTKISVELFTLPFFSLEDENGMVTLKPASNNGAFDKSIPYLPAGKYSYLDLQEAKQLPDVDLGRCPSARSIFYLPVYSIDYEAGNWRGRAMVVGESWQVLGAELPRHLSASADFRIITIAAILCAIYYLLARAIPSFLPRIAAILLVSCLLYSIHVIRERMGE